MTDFQFCQECEYIPYCTGNCPGLAYSLVGKIDHPSPDACLRKFLAEGGGDHISIGDVILFRYKGKLITHRVIDITQDSIKTRGDNNDMDDIELLAPRHIIGKITAAWQGRRRRKIYGDIIGQFFSNYIRICHIFRCIIPILNPVFAVDYDLLKRLHIFNLKRVIFNIGDKEVLRLMIGPHIVGHYDRQIERWYIYLPFPIFV